MLVLLPPSEGKSTPLEGAPLDLADLSNPVLNATRDLVLESLVALCRDEPQRAIDTLGLGPTQSAEVGRNAALRSAPTAAAWDVYSGVLFEALNLPGMDAQQLARADSSILISSALFGWLSPSDRIPAYRLSAGVRLPGLPPPRALWRAPLAEALDALPQPGPVVDLRSGAYAALHRAAGDAAGREWLHVSVLLEKDGRRSVVSHHNKATKGRLVADLMEVDPSAVTGPSDLVDVVRGCGWTVEIDGSTLRIVVPAV